MTVLRVSYLIGRLDRVIRAELEAALAEFSLTIAELTALSVLAARPGLSNARLARRSLVTPQGMHRVTRSLEERGLVERTTPPGGGRSLETRITAKGADLLALADDARQVAEDRCLAELDDHDRREFERLLRAVSRLHPGVTDEP